MDRRVIFLESRDLFNEILLPVNKRIGYALNSESVNIPVYFYRIIGLSGSAEEHFVKLNSLYNEINKNNLTIIFESTLSFLNNLEKELFDAWNVIESNYDTFNMEFIETKYFIDLLMINFNRDFVDDLKIIIKDILKIFIDNKINCNKTIIKNFLLKQIIWLKQYNAQIERQIINKFDQGEDNYKILFLGEIKEHEVYFLTLMAKLGCDVIYINTDNNDIFSKINGINYMVKKIDYYNYIKTVNYNDKLNSSKVVDNNKNYPRKNLTLYDFQDILRDKKQMVKDLEYEEIAKLSTSIVQIFGINKENKVISGGSGVIISDDGVIVTNNHIIAGTQYYKVLFEDSKDMIGQDYYTVLCRDVNRDIAILKINSDRKRIRICVNTGNIRRGQKIVAIGSPLGLMNTISDGIVSGFRDFGKEKFIQITAPISPGSSGGALFNMKGELIGITTAGYEAGQNLNLAIDASIVVELLQSRATVLNYSIMRNFDKFIFNNNAYLFDGFFGSWYEDVPKISLYQNRQDSKSIIDEISRDVEAKLYFENYYKKEISNILRMNNIKRFVFEIGSSGKMYTFYNDNGEIYNEKWQDIK